MPDADRVGRATTCSCRSSDAERVRGADPGRNARKVSSSDTGHVPMLERPARFNQLVAEFLAGERAPGEPMVDGVSA